MEMLIGSSLPKAKLAALQRLQNRAFTIIKSAKITDNWTCPRMSVERKIYFDRKIMTYKVIDKIFLDWQMQTFLANANQGLAFLPYNTRNSHNLQTTVQWAEHYKKSFPTQPFKNWNDTFINKCELRNLNTFKRKLITFFKSKT